MKNHVEQSSELKGECLNQSCDMAVSGQCGHKKKIFGSGGGISGKEAKSVQVYKE